MVAVSHSTRVIKMFSQSVRPTFVRPRIEEKKLFCGTLAGLCKLTLLDTFRSLITTAKRSTDGIIWHWKCVRTHATDVYNNYPPVCISDSKRWITQGWEGVLSQCMAKKTNRLRYCTSMLPCNGMYIPRGRKYIIEVVEDFIDGWTLRIDLWVDGSDWMVEDITNSTDGVIHIRLRLTHEIVCIDTCENKELIVLELCNEGIRYNDCLYPMHIVIIR